MVLGHRMNRSMRRWVALGLIAGGAFTARPAIADAINRVRYWPESARENDRRLKSIRDAALPADIGIYDGD